MSNFDTQAQLRFGIINAYNYWIEIIQPNWLNYKNTPTPRTAFNLANSLWSIIEWIKNDPAHDFLGLSTKEIQIQFEELCPALSIMHDLCTHGKHYTVSKPRSDSKMLNDELTGAVICFNSPIGPVSEQTVDFKVVLAEGEQVPLNQVIDEAMTFWVEYFNQKK